MINSPSEASKANTTCPMVAGSLRNLALMVPMMAMMRKRMGMISKIVTVFPFLIYPFGQGARGFRSRSEKSGAISAADCSRPVTLRLSAIRDLATRRVGTVPRKTVDFER